MVLSASPIYSAATVTGATGIKPERFQSWLSREFFVPDLEVSTGRGSRRLFTGFAILRIGVASYLADNGCKFPLAYDLAGQLLSYGADNEDFSYLAALTQGEEGFHNAAGARGFRSLAALTEAVNIDEFETLLVVNVGKLANQIQRYLEAAPPA